MSSALTELATRAYVYGIPLVFNLDQVRRFATTGVGANPAANFNVLSHARTLAGPTSTFVSINNDTVYSMSQLDLSAGPVLLELPDSAGRYYVMQFVSAWTENVAYLGKRATGTRAGRYLVVGPNWHGQVPESATVIRCPTEVASIVGRWAVDDEADLQNVIDLQDRTVLTPIGHERGRGLPDVDTHGLDEALTFWEKYRIYSQTFAPPARDRDLQAGFAALGLTGHIPVGDLSDDRRDALRRGYAAGADAMRRLLRNAADGRVNGWQINLHAFDYNLDHYGVGALDEPRWKITDPDMRLLTRAGAALAGLWGTNAYEALYFPAYADDEGNPLTGEHEYEITLDPTPPNDAFWSITMYDAQDYYLVANGIDRYSIGDRTEGLIQTDGAVHIRLGTNPPAAGSSSNWLPAPPGPFRPMLRVYLPTGSLLDGTYALPPIRRLR